jgi:hypothetical protein
MSYREQLAQQLAAVGITGRLRARILAEVEDHLGCDPDAQLGEPAALARRFVDELGTRRALSAAFSAFGALAVAGLLFAAAVLAVPHAGGFASVQKGEPGLSLAGVIVSVLAAQVALAAGGLGWLRALRRRRAELLSEPEALVLVRRAGVGLSAGALTLTGLALTAAGTDGHIAAWWTVLAFCACGAGAIALAIATRPLLRAHSLMPTLEGSAGDLGEDLRGLLPPLLDAGSWSFALLFACGLAIAVALAGVGQDDPLDGLLRGLADGAVFLLCYAVLGRYLGLRQPRAPRSST